MLTFGLLGTIHDIVGGQPLYKAVLAIFSTIFMALDSMVYAVVNYTYTMFTYIAGARILDSDTLVDMANRVYIVIGVIALFLVAYALLTAIINPDNASKGEKSLGKIIPNIAKAIVGIALVPTIFSYAYKIQKEVLCNNIIPRWLLEDKYETINPTQENAGAELATELFQSFFFINPDRTSNEDKSWWDSLFTPEFDESDYYSAVNNARDGESFILAFGPLIDNVTSADITYFMLISTIAGLFCAYVLLGYCLDAGLRAIKLAYLQLLAPLPILLTIIPGQDKVFKKWLSKTVSCFLEVFVRIFAMTFVLYIINHLPPLLDSSSEIFESACGTGPGIIMLFLIKAILICALFDFLKQAPKLVSEITGIDSKGFGIGLKGKGILGDTLSTLGGTVTAAAGAGYFARKNGQDVVAAMKYGATKNLKGKGKGNQFGTSARDYYKTILRDDKEPSLLTGKQKANDKNLDDYIKLAQNGYVDYRKKKYEQDSTFKGFVNDYVNAAVQNERNNRQNNLNEAQRDYDDAMDRRDRIIQRANADVSANESKLATLENELANYRNSKEYMQNLKAGQSTIENYQNQINEAKRALDESRTRAEAAKNTYDPDMKAAESNLQKAREEYNKRIDPKDYQSAAIEQARARYAKLTKDEINTLSNGDPYLGEIIKQTQEDIDFVVTVENQKAGKDFANSLEGQKYAQTWAASMKQAGVGSPVKTGEFGPGQNAGGSGKPNGQK